MARNTNRPVSAKDVAAAARMLRIAARFLEDQQDELVYDNAECDHYCAAEECRTMASTLDGKDPLIQDGCVCTKPEPDDEQERCTDCGGFLADIPDNDGEDD